VSKPESGSHETMPDIGIHALVVTPEESALSFRIQIETSHDFSTKD
jgi:hypothetical protein